MFVKRAVFFSPENPPAPGAPGEPPAVGNPPPGEKGPGDKTPTGQGNDDSGDPDFASLDPKTQNYIKKLRKENAETRKEFNVTKGKLDSVMEKVKSVTGENPDENLTPEQRIEHLSGHVEHVAMENVILHQAIHHGIPAADLEYFQFKVAKAVDALEEGEELDEEQIAQIVAEVKGKSAPKSGATSPSGGSAGTPPPKSTADDGITVEKFAASLSVQNAMYVSDQARYIRLRDEAQAKGLYNKR